MQTLQRLLATSVVEALEKREHVIIAPGRTDALADEVEGIIAPCLPTITANLEPERQVLGEVTSTFGHEAADDAVESAVDEIAERLMESDHVDDIFADDRLIRRDAFRAIQAVLLRYVRGELAIADEDNGDGAHSVELDRLGYLVSTVAQRADPPVLEAALSRAARALGASLVRLDAADRRATFAPEAAGTDVRLALEEAITEQLVDLVDSDQVELPTMERILTMPATAARQPGFAQALQGAAHRTQQITTCAAACTVVDSETLLASLTPLSEDSARHIDHHFDTFLESLELAIASLEHQPHEAPKSSSRDRRSARKSSQPPASAKPRKSSKAGAARTSKPPSSRKPASKAGASRKSKPPSSRKPATKTASRKSKPPSSRKPASKAGASRTSKPPSSRKPATKTASRASKPPSSRKPSRAAAARPKATSTRRSAALKSPAKRAKAR